MTCADMGAEGYVYNPPSENKGLVLRIALERVAVFYRIT